MIGTDLYPVLADVTDDAAVRAAVAEAGRALGRLDIVVNNAGIGAAGTVEDNDDAEWHRVLDVNVLGIVRTTRAALPLLRQAARERGQAAIVNTCSVAAIAGLQQRALYSATKGAVYSLTLAMAADHVAEGIRVNCVTPGTADTPWVGRLLDAAPDPAPNAPRSTRASRWAGWSARTRSPRPSPTWPARWPGPPPARRWPWTAACRACGSGRDRPDVAAGNHQRSDDIDVSVWYQPANAGYSPLTSRIHPIYFPGTRYSGCPHLRPAPARAAGPESATRRFP